MATVQILNFKKYTKAIGLLYEMGGLFRTKPTRQIGIGPYQRAVLRYAGCLPPSEEASQKSGDVPGRFG
ncbi:MAG: hypothetical protein HY289_03310 [Planctomycetes bacterium]|nr:hypothetical protein [Planctomycetota bacterium]